MDLANLPKPFLVRLFVLLQFDPKSPEYEECPTCYRPFWWILRQKTGKNLRLVCKTWRDMYWKVLVNWPMGTVGPLFVCVTPTICADKLLQEVIKHRNRVYEHHKLHKTVYTCRIQRRN